MVRKISGKLTRRPNKIGKVLGLSENQKEHSRLFRINHLLQKSVSGFKHQPNSQIQVISVQLSLRQAV